MGRQQQYWKEGVVGQGVRERIPYTLDTTPWGGAPSAPVVTVKLDGTDVTSTVTTGSPTVNGDDILLPVIHSLTAGKRYRVEVQWVSAGATFEAPGYIDADQ